MIRIQRIILIIVALLMISFCIPVAYADINFTTLRYTIPGEYTYTVHDEVRSVYVTVVGAGGGGGGGSGGVGSPTGTHSGSGGGGGGSGYYQLQTIEVTPGNELTIIVGAGGAGGIGSSYSYGQTWDCSAATDGTAGGPSQVEGVIANGGSPGTGSSCYNAVGTNGAGYSVGTPPSGSTAGTGGVGVTYFWNPQGSGGGGGNGGSASNTSSTGWGRGANASGGAPGYVQIEPIKPPVPVAGFNMTPYSGQYPLNVQFTDLSIGYPTSWTWNFGDGTTFTTTDPALKSPNHTYTAANTYTVTLTVTNSQLNHGISHEVYVTGPPAAPTQNAVEYTKPGIYNYTVPSEIQSLYITVVGAGGAGGGGSGGGGNGTASHYGAPAGGGGSGYSQVMTINVTPGEVIPVMVGRGGLGGMGGLYDYRYFPWICGPGTDGTAGGFTQFGNITVTGGQPGTGSTCYTEVGLNGTGYKDGTPGTPNPPAYTANSGTAGTGGAGYVAYGSSRGSGANGGGGGSNAKFSSPWVYSIGNGGNGGDGANGYVRIEPIKPPVPVAGFNMTPYSGQYPLNVQFTDLSTGYPISWQWYFGDGATFTTTDPALKSPNHTYTAAGTYNARVIVTNSAGNHDVTHQVYVAGPPAAPTQNSVEYTVPGVYNYTVPAEIQSLYVTVVGAGGAGGGGSGGGANGTVAHYGAPAGGGGSGYTQAYLTINVTPGEVIPMVVGRGGLGGIGGPWDYRYFPWICSPGTNGTAGGFTQFGNITVNGGLPGTGSICFNTVGTNGTGLVPGTPGIPNPPQYTTSAGSAGSGGTGFMAYGSSRGAGANGGSGGNKAKFDSPWAYPIGNGGNGGDGINGYIRIEPIKPPVPVAGFNMTPYSGQYPLNVQFTDLSAGYPTSWSWYIGDGTTFTTTDPALKNLNHTFTTAGAYNVKLIITNSQGSHEITRQVYVAGSPAAPSQNAVEYTLPGVYNYTVASGVGLLKVTIIGAGGAGGGGSGGGGNGTVTHYGAPAGGGGSGYYNVSNISVSPGQVIPIAVGLGGYGGMGGVYDYRYSPWICSPGTDGTAGGFTQFGNITMNGGLPGTGSICYDTVGMNGGGWSMGTNASPNPPTYTINSSTPGTGGTGFVAYGSSRGSGANGASGGNKAKFDSPWAYPIGNGGSGGDGGNGYIRIEPFVLPKPVVSFNATPTSGLAPLDVNFTDLSTNYPTSWTWDFGDGSNSTEQNPSHEYTVAGTYSVNHSATNGIGTGWLNRTAYVNVTGQGPVVDFLGTPLTGCEPLIVSFYDLSTGSPTSWNWSFGDGNTSTMREPRHTYAAGNYTVSLTATNDAGSNTTTKIEYVTVWEDPDYYVYAEVGECSLVDSAEDFWTKINNAHREDVVWKDSGRGLLVKPCNPAPCTGDTCPRASHWTSPVDADQWIGKADFVYYSGHGGPGDPPPPQSGPGYIIITDDGDNTANANNMRLNSSGKIKWVVFDSCDTLYDVDDSSKQWVPSFDNGLHMLLGWQTSVVPSVENDEYRGGVFALLMKGNYKDDETHYSMIDAWYKAGVFTYLSYPHYSSYDVWNAVMYCSDINGENGCKNDHLPGWDTFCTNPQEWGYVTWYPQLVFAQSSSRSSSLASIKSRSMNLQEGTYSLAASVPVTNNNSITYEAVKSGYTKEQVSSLAKSLGMSGDIRETNDAFYPSDKDAEQFLFTVEKKSSMITFRKNDIGSSTIQSDAQIISAANTFLQKNNLMPPGKSEPRVVHNTAVIYSRSGQRVGERKINVVVYPQIINGLPVFNAQFNVEVGSDGNIIGLFKNWRDYKPAEKITLKSPEEAFGELKTHQPKSKTIIPEKVKVTGVSLGYFMHSSSDGEEEYLQPAYIFEGINQRGNLIEPFEPVIIDAKKEEVRENITSPTPTPTSTRKTEFTGNTTQNETLTVITNVIATQTITPPDISLTIDSILVPTSTQNAEITDNTIQNEMPIVTVNVTATQNITIPDISPTFNQNIPFKDNTTNTTKSPNPTSNLIINSTVLKNETANNGSITRNIT